MTEYHRKLSVLGTNMRLRQAGRSQHPELFRHFGFSVLWCPVWVFSFCCHKIIQKRQKNPAFCNSARFWFSFSMTFNGSKNGQWNGPEASSFMYRQECSRSKWKTWLWPQETRELVTNTKALTALTQLVQHQSNSTCSILPILPSPLDTAIQVPKLFSQQTAPLRIQPLRWLRPLS